MPFPAGTRVSPALPASARAAARAGWKSALAASVAGWAAARPTEAP
jgi:hypothetical protein